jgi:hypothetical protein
MRPEDPPSHYTCRQAQEEWEIVVSDVYPASMVEEHSLDDTTLPCATVNRLILVQGK